MITIKFLGGAKKSFSSDKLEIDEGSMTVSDLLVHLQKSAHNNTAFDSGNILIAINGVDSSALEGKGTLLKNGDIVSIIPLIHGGKNSRTRLKIMNTNVELIELKKTIEEPVRFLEILRKKYPELIIQGVNSNYILNIIHAKKVIAVSLAAKKSDILLSDKIETDILMRFACTRQINDAINKAGLQKGKYSILIVAGRRISIDKLYKEIRSMVKEEISTKSPNFIRKEFGITSRNLKSVISITPLEDLLSERSAVLFR